jgi:putative colanic acid biosynthesis UDP-glucose lipid carrier transferase
VAASTSTRLTAYAPPLDALALITAGGISWLLRFPDANVAAPYPIALLLAFLLAIILLPLTGAYRHPHCCHPVRGVVAAAPGLLLVFASLLAIAMLTKSTAEFSRLWMLGWVILSVPGLSVWRLFASTLPTSASRRILMLGTGPLACATVSHLQSRQPQNQVIGMLALPGEPETAGLRLPATFLGHFTELDELLNGADSHVDELWLAPDGASAIPDTVLQSGLSQSSLPVRYVPDLTVLRMLQHRINDVDGLTVIELNATPLDGPEGVVKALMDRTLAAVALLALSPLLVLIAALVRLDSPGPALFKQARHGGGGRIIRVFKFRTMHTARNADTRQASRNDPRVTRIGRFLRRSSLDELPQLFNVLQGDMSLVGPRPHPLELNDQYRKRLDTYMQRHRVKPGITGWAQINGCRGATETLDKMQKRLEYDLYYIENWSIWLDIKILAKTALLGWSGRNAY